MFISIKVKGEYVKCIKQTKIVIFFLLFTNLFVLADEVNNFSEAINIAGKQRMFTQRMLKDYAMVGMNNSYGNPKEDLLNVITSFESNLQILEKFNTNTETNVVIVNTEKLWKTVKMVLEKVPNKDEVKELQEELDKLLSQSNDIVMLFVKQSGMSKSEIINISGRQRMLSQRMAGLYMLKVWGVDDSEFKSKMIKTMELFKESLDTLLKAKETNDEIMIQLKKSKRAFLFFEIMNRSNSKFIPALIYKKSNEILKVMDNATKLYTRVSK